LRRIVVQCNVAADRGVRGHDPQLLAEVETAELDYQRKTLVNLPCTRVQADEVWSCVQCKERPVQGEKRPARLTGMTRYSPPELASIDKQ
jgi:hypothetical protein